MNSDLQVIVVIRMSSQDSYEVNLLPMHKRIEDITGPAPGTSVNGLRVWLDTAILKYEQAIHLQEATAIGREKSAAQ